MKLLVIALLLSISLHAQIFEVTSVKPHGPAVRGAQGILPACKDGRFVAVAPMVLVIRWIYDLTQLQGVDLTARLPQWAQSISGSYDLEATYNGQVLQDQCRKMVESLLVDRFKFASHWETETGVVYNLVVARNGPKLSPVREGDESRGLNITMNGKMGQVLPGTPVVRGLTMAEFSELLTNRLRMTVINKTNLQGLYKINLAYSQGAAANREFADPDIFTAVQQQLGLKLEEGRGPIQHLIVDHIEMPTEN